MSGTLVAPILPCRDVDEIVATLAMDDAPTARARLAEARALPLDDLDRATLGEHLERAGELEREVDG